MYKIDDCVSITEIAEVIFEAEENCIIFLPLSDTLKEIMLADLPSPAVADEILKNLFQDGKVDITEYAKNTAWIDDQDDEV